MIVLFIGSYFKLVNKEEGLVQSIYNCIKLRLNNLVVFILSKMNVLDDIFFLQVFINNVVIKESFFYYRKSNKINHNVCS